MALPTLHPKSSGGLAVAPDVRLSPDAFEVLLGQAWRVSQDEELQTLGKLLQRSGNKGRRDVHAAVISRRRVLCANTYSV